jgi:SAM-dependent methyltransferase
MKSIQLEEFASTENFDENAYLLGNTDVSAAVKSGTFQSGRHHFELFGKNENRKLYRGERKSLILAKQKKMEAIKTLLREDMKHTLHESHYDFLTQDLSKEFNITETDAISSNDYDPATVSLIQKHKDGIVLDCGAGKRSVYFSNVVNFEIVPYETTDVRGVGEVLPFKDNSFDAVISIAVLEHVKDPFKCASEIARVLKPGGDLRCAVPFLQPLHGYPNHYYNMSHQGLRNLFEEYLVVDNIEVLKSTLPIWTLTWILQSWVEGLPSEFQQEFRDLQIKDLLTSPIELLEKNFVKNLSVEKNFELASACLLSAHKPL